VLRSMSSLQSSLGKASRTAKKARALEETSFDALPDAVALKILLLAPIDVRLRIGALLQRRCARLLREPDAWRVIDFRGCDAPVSDRALLLLCARAGAALRCLDLSGCDANRSRVTTLGIIGALRGAAGFSLERLFTRSADDDQRFLCRFDDDRAVVLRKTCPRLRDGTFLLKILRQTMATSALDALPGQVYLDARNDVLAAGSYAHLLSRLTARESSRGGADCGALVGLWLNGATLTHEGADALTELMMCAKLRELSLHISSVNDDRGACAVLAHAMRRSRLQSLRLEVDDLGDEVQAIVALLSDANCSLKSLRLYGLYRSGPSYVVDLVAAIAANASLTELHLLDVSVDDEDVSALARACASHTMLREVCCLGGGICKALRETLTMLMAIKTPHPLHWSWAFRCLIQDEEVREQILCCMRASNLPVRQHATARMIVTDTDQMEKARELALGVHRPAACSCSLFCLTGFLPAALLRLL
jgi:hypothetical protein